MANSSLAYRSSISIKSISNSVSGLRKGISNTQRTAINMSSVLSNSNKQKRNQISKSESLFQKRREAVRRKEQEDIVEASSIGGAVKRTGKVISSSTKGFLGRIFDFVGTLMVGWLLNNLPTIIKLSKILVDRIQKYVSIGSSALSGISEMMLGFGGVLGGIYSNIISFDFTDSQGKVSNSMDKLLGGFNKLQDSMFRFIDLFSGDFDKLIGLVVPTVKGIDIPDTGGTTVDETGGASSGGSSSGGSSSGGGGRWKPLLDVIGSAEGGYTSIAPGDSNPDLTRMTIAQAAKSTGLKGGKGAIGRYQLTTPLAQAKRAGLGPDDIFSPANQDKIAIQLIKERGGDDWLRGKITTDRFALELAQEWAGLPKDSGGKSYYAGDGRNAANVSWGAVIAALNKVKEAPVQTSRPSGSPTPPPTQIGRLRGGEKLTSKIGKGVEYVEITDVYKDPDRPTHKGIDIAAPAGTYIALRVDCRVVATAYQRDGYGYVIDVWVPQYNVQLRFAHCQSFIITSGEVKAGTSFARVGSTGKSSGPHIHFEYSTKYNDTTYGGSGDPSAYVGLILLTNGKSQASATAAQTNKPPAAQINIESSSRDVAALKKEKSANVITVPVPQQPQQGASAPIMSDSGPSFTPSGDNVNTFITKKLLLDLAYT